MLDYEKSVYRELQITSIPQLSTAGNVNKTPSVDGQLFPGQRGDLEGSEQLFFEAVGTKPEKSAGSGIQFFQPTIAAAFG